MTGRAGSVEHRPDLAISVRRARPGDTHAVLDFARATWDGWDYIPTVWGSWLQAADGVLLVATPNVRRELDLFGRPLHPDRPIGIARVAMLSPDEAWLEGLRVDPGVRNRGVARLLHGACLVWARAQGATSVRYATGAGNEGSHRLGAHHGFRLLRPWRSYQPPRDEAEDAEDAEAYAAGADEDAFADLADEAEGEVPLDIAALATGGVPDDAVTGPNRHEAPDGVEEPGPEDAAAEPGSGRPIVTPAGAPAGRGPLTREIARRRLRRAGLLLDPGAAPEAWESWWGRVDADPTFAMGDRLYEFRSWAFQELTLRRFAEHVRSGDVLAVERGGSRGRPRWALAIVPLGEAIAADERPWAALVAGDGDQVLELAVATRAALGRPLRLRVPDGAPMVANRTAAFVAAGLPPADDTLHILARELPPDVTIDVGAPGAVTFEEPPRRVTVPPSPGR
jgi:GNAT superfamily N-acetyltransferase